VSMAESMTVWKEGLRRLASSSSILYANVQGLQSRGGSLIKTAESFEFPEDQGSS
jgi:hypothetical protein